MLRLTDGGMETTLIFREGIDLPEFAAFPLLATEGGRAALRRYFEPYVELARRLGAQLVLDTPTWRANVDWGEKLGYSPDDVDQASRDGVALLADVRADAGGEPPVVVCGCVGPRGDAYDGTVRMSPEEAEAYHARQVRVFAETEADLISCLTMPTVEEALGIARAAVAAGLPVVISFTVETDGRLPSGLPLGEAIEQVDADTDGAPRYFMINCAHPTHFAGVLEGDGWLDRIGGLRANASTKSHAELDEAEEIDEGDPVALGAEHAALRPRLRSVRLIGGCCGTDHRHVAELCAAWTG
jgi:homocysteine S-methyltransferase